MTELDTALFLSTLSSLSYSDVPNHNEIADEFESISAILGEENCKFSIYESPPSPSKRPSTPVWSISSPTSPPLRVSLTTKIQSLHGEEINIKILISINTINYPLISSPLLLLQDKYLGSFEVTNELFGLINRTYMHEDEIGIEWFAGSVCLYEGIEYVKNLCEEFIQSQEKNRLEQESIRETARIEVEKLAASVRELNLSNGVTVEAQTVEEEEEEEEQVINPRAQLRFRTTIAPDLVYEPKLIGSEPIMDRKSMFVAHVATVSNLAETRVVMNSLLCYPKIQRASHNISAYTFISPSGNVVADHDDDGESGAGAKLSALLALLGCENVMVVASRWYGGTQLGADRFKHINNSARDALEKAGALNRSGGVDKNGGGIEVKSKMKK